MQFHEVRFPANLSFGSLGGPERRTEIVTLANGFEERNTPWEHSRRRYDAGLALSSSDDVETVLAFFEARRGQLYGFRWKDWSDYRSAPPSQEIDSQNQIIGAGDGESLQFQLCKHYRSSEYSYCRAITKPVEGTVQIAIGDEVQRQGTNYEIDPTTGIVTFQRAPDIGVPVLAGFEFDVPVRFDSDLIQASAAAFRAGNVPSIPVVEVRLS